MKVSNAVFEAHERDRQTAFFNTELSDSVGYRGSAFRLFPQHALLNLSPLIRDRARAYFQLLGITWHTHSNHALSSQACCLNFLMPLAERPALLARLVGRALKIPEPEMLQVEPGPDGQPWYVGFEWIGGDYLNESRARARKRGANCTSADAVLKYRDRGTVETLLVEWKYTEKYGQPLRPSGNETRIKRYKDLMFDPNGPFRSDAGLKLEDFFYEPFYQLARQQMLAFQMQRAREGGSDRVRVLHIAPTGNTALKKVTSPGLAHRDGNAFEVFRELLMRPDDFISRSTEEVFGPLISEIGDGDEWSSYLARRYSFLGERS